jgi:hypothetical protein
VNASANVNVCDAQFHLKTPKVRVDQRRDGSVERLISSDAHVRVGVVAPSQKSRYGHCQQFLKLDVVSHLGCAHRVGHLSTCVQQCEQRNATQEDAMSAIVM